MARTSITYTEVKNTCLALESRGDKVTVRSIRAELGSGSDATIAEHLRRYRDEQSKNDEEAVLNQLSQNLRANFIKFVQVASNDLKSIENDTIKQITSELSELREVIRKLELENEKLVADNAQEQKRTQYYMNMSTRNKQDIEQLQTELKESREKETQARIECAVLQSKTKDRDAEILKLEKIIQEN